MRNVWVIALLVVFTSIQSQTKDYFQIALKDATNEEPIAFATVRIKDSKQGLIADAEGEFRLPLGFKAMETVLTITSIGYTSIAIEVSKLVFDEVNIFYLEPNIESLNEVVIIKDESKRRQAEAVSNLIKSARSLTSDEIIYLAIQNIPVNLSTAPSSVLGYYRDYQIVNDEYYNLNEGIIELFDHGILTGGEAYENFKAAIFSYRNNLEFKRDTTYIVPYNREDKYIQNASIRSNGGNELTILNVHNPIRNYGVNTFSFVYVLKSFFLNNHKSRRDGITYLDGEPLVLIRFELSPNYWGLNKQVSLNTRNVISPKHEVLSHKAFGEILISLKDYSIHRFNYEVFDGDKNNALFNLNIEYRRQNGNMFLNYITFNNRFTMADKNILREEDISFYPDKNKFRITFNKEINLNSIKKSYFNIKYGNNKLYIEEIIHKTNSSIELKVRPFFRNNNELSTMDPSKLTFRIRKIKDLDGKEIYEPQLIVGYQFREFFTQEVFPNKPIPDNQFFMINELPIDVSKQNQSKDADKYWLNSPLRGAVSIKRTN